MPSVVPSNGWQALRAWCRKVPTVEPIARLKVELRTSRTQSEYTPGFNRNEDGKWVVGASMLINGDGEPGTDGQRLADAIIEQVEAQFEGYPATSRITVRLHAYARDGRTRPVSPGVDHFQVVGEPGDPDEHSRDEWSATALAKRDGVMTAVQSRDAERMLPFMVLSMMEHTERILAQAGRMNDRAMAALEASQATNDSLARATLDAHRATITAQGEADTERRARDLQEKDDDVRRSLIAMFGKQVGRGIDLAMVKFGGLAPDDPEMKRMFLKGMLSNNPTLGADVAEAFQDGSIDPATMLPALGTWARANPGKAMEFGERLLAEIGEAAR